MIRYRLGLALLVASGLSVVNGSAMAACPPEAQSRESLLVLRDAKWAVDDAARLEVLALGLVDCLADPDPALNPAASRSRQQV
jgi:hypothetical protein